MPQDERESPRRPGPLTRLRSWLSRDPVDSHPSIIQIRAEWAEYQIVFNDILTRWSAKLAREAKVEAKRQARLQEAITSASDGPDHRPPPLALTGKQALRSRFAAQVLGGGFSHLPRNGETHDVDASQGE